MIGGRLRSSNPCRTARHPALVACAGLLLGALVADASAQDNPAPRTALRVCQDPNNMPFSNVAGEGIENKIAEVFGKALGLPVTYYSFPQRMAFIRNTLRFKLPGQDYPCDIVLGVPAGFDQVSVTKPYYRSTYALVFPKGKGMDQVSFRRGFPQARPGQTEGAAHRHLRPIACFGMARQARACRTGRSVQDAQRRSAAVPGRDLEKDLATGTIDAAIVWGPIAGYYAQRVKQPALVVVPLKSERGVKFDYQMAMGVRYGEREWKQQVEGLIDAKQPEIQAILKEYGVPLVDASYEAPKP